MRFRAHRFAVVTAALALAVTAFAVSAQSVYRYVDPDGRIVYSDRPPPPDVKNVQTKRLGANYVETSEPSLTAQMAAERFPVTLYTFDCGEICQNAEGLLNRRGVPFTTVDVQKDEQGRLRLHTLKIDVSFVRQMLASAPDRAIVASTIHLAHDLGFGAVAEGIEDGETLAALVAMGCDEGQGFHLGRPMPPAELGEWLAAHAPAGATRH